MASKMPSMAVNPYMQELCMVVEYQGRETSLLRYRYDYGETF